MVDDSKRWRTDDQRDYYATVGYLCRQWTAVERLYSHLASDIMGLDRKKHDLIFRHLGIVSIAQFLKDYATAEIKSKAAIEQLEFVAAYVDICRRNRNEIIHGFAEVGFDPKAFTVSTYPDQRRSKGKEFVISLVDVERVSDECETAGLLAVRLQFLFSEEGKKTANFLFGRRWRSVLFARPVLPRSVSENPIRGFKPPFRRKLSRASRRKDALERTGKLQAPLGK